MSDSLDWIAGRKRPIETEAPAPADAPPLRFPLGMDPPPVPPDIEAAARALLTSLPELAALSGRIYTGNVPQTPTRPFLVMSMLFADPELNNSSSWPEEYRIQYTVVSETYPEARTLGKAALSALNPPKNPPLVFADGNEQTRLIGRRRYFFAPGPSANAMGLCHWSFDVIHRVSRDF